ncbi:hypothetical protein FPOAC2_04430 [Fusarium poae]|jgi:hypothetical protein|uniref:hypothetical protein n=1 Tax=Fusarium poae TaxID=36050 RepID=UPI001CEB4C1A|nr:hypothetical protein FPOAC1_004345 [Fusarium poae]KAG8671107.1 hypothetical protein FPOAC1_004345 [Fusarium poae]
MACQTFECFGKLPPEIRIQIYLLATPPRAVSLGLVTIPYDEWLRGYCKRGRSQPGSIWTKQLWNYDSQSDLLGSITQIPALLHTCKESREELINHGYELTFATSRGPRTWFNYRQDALCLPFALWTCPQIRHTFCLHGQRSDERLYVALSRSDKKKLRWVVESTAYQRRQQDVFTGREDMSKDGQTSAPFLATDQLSWWHRAVKHSNYQGH